MQYLFNTDLAFYLKTVQKLVSKHKVTKVGSLSTEIAPLLSPLVSEESAAINLPNPEVDEAPLAKRLSKKSSRLLSFEESQ